jgi:hypothetical protein
VEVTEPIFDDSTPDNPVVPAGFSTGWKGAYRSGMTAADVSIPFPAELLIPEHEWQARIEEMEERKSRTSDLIDQAGVPVLNQQQTNFCWAFAPTMCLMITHAIQNQPLVVLSPASVACPITGFKNRGGYGGDSLEYIIEHGIVPASQWPQTAIDRKYLTEANKQAALLNRATEWWSLRPRNVQEQISCLLRRIPLSTGLNYWGHQVCDVDPVWVNGKIGVRFRNSWGSEWGQNGYGIRQGNKMPGDDMTCIRVAVAS